MMRKADSGRPVSAAKMDISDCFCASVKGSAKTRIMKAGAAVVGETVELVVPFVLALVAPVELVDPVAVDVEATLVEVTCDVMLPCCAVVIWLVDVILPGLVVLVDSVVVTFPCIVDVMLPGLVVLVCSVLVMFPCVVVIWLEVIWLVSVVDVEMVVLETNVVLAVVVVALVAFIQYAN